MIFNNWGGFMSIQYSVIKVETLSYSNCHLCSSWEHNEKEAIKNAKKMANEFWICLIYAYEFRKIQRHCWGIVPDGFIGYINTQKHFKRFEKPMKLLDAINLLRKLKK